jgi:hypothetical protein
MSSSEVLRSACLASANVTRIRSSRSSPGAYRGVASERASVRATVLTASGVQMPTRMKKHDESRRAFLIGAAMGAAAQPLFSPADIQSKDAFSSAPTIGLQAQAAIRRG